MRHLTPARGGTAAILVIGLRSLALVVTILTGLVSAALLGASGRGVLAALLTGPAFLSGVCSMGLHAAVIYRMKETPEDARRYFGTALLLALAFGAAAIAVGWTLAPIWLHKYDATTIWYGRLLLLALPLTMATWTMTAPPNRKAGSPSRTARYTCRTAPCSCFSACWPGPI